MRFMVKQILAIGLGVGAIFILSSLNYQIFRAYPWVIYVLTLIALVGVLILGRRIHGAKSWIVFGPLSLEPVEIARIGFIIVVAAVLDHPERDLYPLRSIMNVFALGGLHMGLILREPDPHGGRGLRDGRRAAGGGQPAEDGIAPTAGDRREPDGPGA